MPVKVGDWLAPIWEFLKALGPVSLDPLREPADGVAWALEVFPALATIGLFPAVHADKLLKYNPQRRRTFAAADWATLARSLAALATAQGLVELADWAARVEGGADQGAAGSARRGAVLLHRPAAAVRAGLDLRRRRGDAADDRVSGDTRGARGAPCGRPACGDGSRHIRVTVQSTAERRA